MLLRRLHSISNPVTIVNVILKMLNGRKLSDRPSYVFLKCISNIFEVMGYEVIIIVTMEADCKDCMCS